MRNIIFLLLAQFFAISLANASTNGYRTTAHQAVRSPCEASQAEACGSTAAYNDGHADFIPEWSGTTCDGRHSVSGYLYTGYYGMIGCVMDECTGEQPEQAKNAQCPPGSDGVTYTGNGCTFETVSPWIEIPSEGTSSLVGTTQSYGCSHTCVVVTTVQYETVDQTFSQYREKAAYSIAVSGAGCDSLPPDEDNTFAKYIPGTEGEKAPEKDTDGDGIPDTKDADIDGDGIPNANDPDEDGDGVNDKSDIDGDGVPDKDDYDMDGDGIPNSQDDDIDGDGVGNADDGEPNGPGRGPDRGGVGEGEGDGEEDGTGVAANCDKQPVSTGDPQLAAIHKQLWINECEGEELTEEIEPDEEKQGIADALKEKGDTELDDLFQDREDDINSGSENGGPFDGVADSSGLIGLAETIFPQYSSCTPLQLAFASKINLTLPCEKFLMFKTWLGWFVGVVTAWAICMIPFRGQEAKA